MKRLMPLLLTALCIGLSPCSISAQTGSGLPLERELNQHGLTMAWWGRSVIDSKRDRVRFITADEQNVYVQSSSGIVTTFAGETGRRLWANLIGEPEQMSFAAATNDDQLLIAIGMNVYSLDKSNGELRWQLRVPKHPSASPEVDADQVYVGTADGSVFAFDIHRIRELHTKRMLPQWTHMARLWRFKTPNEVISPPVAAGATVSFASQVGIVYGVGNTDKGLKFQFESDGQIQTAIGRSTMHIFIADRRGRTYCINQNNGRLVWAFSSGAPVNQRPRAVGKHVYLIPQREGLKTLSVDSGITIWEQPRASEFVGASESRVYAFDGSGNLLILDRRDGEILGSLPLRNFTLRVNNDRTDRLVLGTENGLVVGLREIGSEYPLYHLYPERRPILPLLGDDGASDEANTTE